MLKIDSSTVLFVVFLLYLPYLCPKYEFKFNFKIKISLVPRTTIRDKEKFMSPDCIV